MGKFNPHPKQLEYFDSDKPYVFYSGARRSVGIPWADLKRMMKGLESKRMLPEQIDNIFTYHKPLDGQPEKYEALREAGKGLAMLINDLCPESREKSTAITNLQQVIMWANASIAINEKEKK